jgi:prolipoprotein diacylglyceryltransferase
MSAPSPESFWVMVFLGFGASTMVTRAEFRRRAWIPASPTILILYAYVGGLVGARLFLVFSHWDRFVEDPSTSSSPAAAGSSTAA